jgi:hypothetical protein
MGAVKGDESTPPIGKNRSDTLDEVSDRVSLLEPGRFRFSSSSIFGSMLLRSRFSHPCATLMLARARRFCRARAI